MNELTEREHLVAEQYCKGLADKEAAIVLDRSEAGHIQETGHPERYGAGTVYAVRENEDRI